MKRSLRRSSGVHKGHFGHAWIIAGSTGMPGAGRLAAEAAMRSGAGKTTWVTTREAYRVMGHSLPEVMSHVCPAASGGGLAASSVPGILRRVLASATAVGVGPGLGRTSSTRLLVRGLIRSAQVPLVLDADALWALEGDVGRLRSSRAPIILTPHNGELARLFGEAQVRVRGKLRGPVAKRIANQYHCVLVWKGPKTQVAAPGGRSFQNTTGNPGLAKGGSGDVLTGIITALAAQGFSAFDAARIGVHAHGWAADLAVRKTGRTALAPSDVIKALPAVWSVLEKRSGLKKL